MDMAGSHDQDGKNPQPPHPVMQINTAVRTHRLKFGCKDKKNSFLFGYFGYLS
jgi:hypothetical protein